MFLPYVYKVTNRNSKKFYIGMRSANKVVAELDLGIHYFTSSKYVKNNFSEFDIQILAYFKDQQSAFDFENTLIESHWGDPLLLNKHFQKNMSKFSMKGVKRPDLSEYNRANKTRKKEDRNYICSECNKNFIRTEFSHSEIKQNIFCSRSCAATHNGRVSSSRRRGQQINYTATPWNKGKKCEYSAENGKIGANKLSQKATGRKRLYKADGTWTWQYPKKEGI